MPILRLFMIGFVASLILINSTSAQDRREDCPGLFVENFGDCYDFKINFSRTETPPVVAGDIIRDQYRFFGMTFGSRLNTPNEIAEGQPPQIIQAISGDLVLNQDSTSTIDCAPLAIGFASSQQIYRVRVLLNSLASVPSPGPLSAPLSAEIETYFKENPPITETISREILPGQPRQKIVRIFHREDTDDDRTITGRDAAEQDPIVGIIIKHPCSEFRNARASVEVAQILVWSRANSSEPVIVEEQCGDGIDNNRDGFVDETCQCVSGECSAGLECVTPFSGENTTPTCQPTCDNFCDAACKQRPDVFNVSEDLTNVMIPDDSLTNDQTSLPSYLSGDDYPGFQELANRVSNRSPNARPVHVVFSKGEYHIKRYHDRYETVCARRSCETRPLGASPADHSALQGENFPYNNANGVHFHGCGSRIDIAPIPFRQVADLYLGLHPNERDDLYRSEAHSITPFIFNDSSNFSVSGFELDGNVDRSSGREPKPPAGRLNAENYSHGLVTASSSNYVLRNLKVHHFMTDGIILGQGGVAEERTCTPAPAGPEPTTRTIEVVRADRNGLLENIDSHNNGRGALSVIQVHGLDVVNSTFSSSGKTDNLDYTGWPGQHGLDIEPDLKPFPGDCSLDRYADTFTGYLRFSGSKFKDNNGLQIAAGGQTSTGNVRFLGPGCEVRARPGLNPNETSRLAIWLSIPGAEINDCDIELSASRIMALDRCIAPRASLKLVNSRIDFEHIGSVDSLELSRVINIEYGSCAPLGPAPASSLIGWNRFSFAGNHDGSRFSPHLYVAGLRTAFIGNHVLVDASVHPRTAHIDHRFVKVPLVTVPWPIAQMRNNIYEISDPENLAPGTAFTTGYGEHVFVTNDRFPSHPAFQAGTPAGVSSEPCPDNPTSFCFNNMP